MPTDGERIATLEESVNGLRDDVSELRQETLRGRTRLHNLEGITGMLVESDRLRRREDKRREDKYTTRLNLLMVIATFAAVASPLIVALIHLKG